VGRFLRHGVVKLKATRGHPEKSITEFHWTTLSKKSRSNNVPIYSKKL